MEIRERQIPSTGDQYHLFHGQVKQLAEGKFRRRKYILYTPFSYYSGAYSRIRVEFTDCRVRLLMGRGNRKSEDDITLKSYKPPMYPNRYRFVLNMPLFIMGTVIPAF